MRNALACALVAVALSGCAHKKSARRVPAAPSAPTAHPAAAKTPAATRDTARATPPAAHASANRAAPTPTPAPSPVFVETGKASWYGYPYHGRTAANGETYDMEQMTAAHRTLPFDTIVHVVNISNEKGVDVRITDRGPFIDGRVIDLSHAAAREIDLIGPGVADVRLEVMTVPDTPPRRSSGAYAVQVGAFRDRNNAERARAQMAAKYGAARLVLRDGSPSLWRVLVGAEKSEDDADALRLKIRKDSGEKNAFVVRLDS